MKSKPLVEYHVGIVCALPKEMVAVVAMFDEKHKPLEEQDLQDKNYYALGRIHRHNVVTACLPAEAYGTNAAAVVASNMLWTFPNVRFGFMVGIGGGIPHLPRDDIRLGDVVVSQPDQTFGGVVQYDLSKNTGDGKFERKGSLDRPPTVLLTALSALQARHYLEDSKVLDYIQEAWRKNPALLKKGYAFPGDANDQLRCSRCTSSQWRWPTRRCTFCTNGIILRQSRECQGPALHYGTIASGNQLVKNAAFRDRLAQEFGAKCVEMEAAGLMNDFRCIVIRGICDYADEYKNDDWQEYAAIAAAGFAKDLLAEMVPAKVSDEKPMKEVIGE